MPPTSLARSVLKPCALKPCETGTFFETTSEAKCPRLVLHVLCLTRLHLSRVKRAVSLPAFPGLGLPTFGQVLLWTLILNSGISLGLTRFWIVVAGTISQLFFFFYNLMELD